MTKRLSILLLIGGMNVSGVLHAQTLSSYDNYMNAVQQSLIVGDFHTVKLLCSQAMIKNVFRPEAYIYTAMAMYKTDQLDEALVYAEKAGQMTCTAAQAEMVRVVQQAVKDKKRFNALLAESALNREAGRLEAARSASYEAWELFPVRVDIAFQTVELMIDLQEFAPAMEVLEKLADYPDPETAAMVKKLYAALDSTPQIIAKKAFEENLAAGDIHMQADRYAGAVDSYRAALALRPDDKQVKEKLTLAEEELAYETAMGSTEIAPLEAYASRYPRGKYIGTVNETLRKRYVAIAQNGHAARDLAVMQDMHSRWASRFPQDTGLNTIIQLMGDYYFTTAEGHLLRHEWSDARSHYQYYLSVLPAGGHAENSRQKIRKCDRRLRQADTHYAMYTYEAGNPIGITFGGLKTDRIGSYVNLKMNPEIFTFFSSLYHIDNAGNHNRPGTVKRTGNVKMASAAFSLGLTFKIVYPLYGYAGAGVAYKPVYEEADTYFDSGDFWEEDWLRNTDRTSISVFPEAGIKLKVSNALVLKAGLTYDQALVSQFGFGIQL